MSDLTPEEQEEADYWDELSDSYPCGCCKCCGCMCDIEEWMRNDEEVNGE